MEIPEPNHDLMRLFEAVLSQQASESEIRQLETLLDESEQVRDQFAAVSQLDVNIRHLFRTEASSLGEWEKQSPPGPHTPSQTRTKNTRRSAWLWSCAIAAAIGLAVYLPAFIRSDQKGEPQVAVSVPTTVPASKPPAPVATLSSQFDAEWRGMQLVEGQPLREGDTIDLARGEARISVGYGAEIAAQGPCSLTFVSRDSIRLSYGEVAVHVAKWAKGFTVVTDSMEVVDLGTTFTVSASKDAGSETNVVKGLVRVHPLASVEGQHGGVLVAEGEGLFVDRRGSGGTRPAARSDFFDKYDFSDLLPYRPVDLYNSGIGLAEGDEDPNWKIVSGPGTVGDEKPYAVVCKPDERYLANTPDVSQWVSMPNWKTAAPNSVYTFQTTFDLLGYDLSTIQLFGRFLADNGIHAVRVNGEPVKVESWVDNVYGQQFDHNEFRFLNVTDGLVNGTNTVEIDVLNGIFQEPAEQRGDPNPMALRVEWYAFGRQAAKPIGNAINGAIHNTACLDAQRRTWCVPNASLSEIIN